MTYTLSVVHAAGAVSKSFPTIYHALTELDCVTDGAMGTAGLCDLLTETKRHGGAIRQVGGFVVTLIGYSH